MPRRSNRASLSALALATLGLALAGCGGGGGGSGATKRAVDGKIDVSAFDPYRFDVGTILTSSTKLTVTLHERGGQNHTFAIPSLKFEIKVSADHPEATGTVVLQQAQTYSFKCSFDGHAAAGMVGKIVVG